MALIEKKTIDRIEVGAANFLGVVVATVIERDGVEISRIRERVTLHPGASLDGMDPKVTAVASAVWTPEVVAAFKAEEEKRAAAANPPVPAT